MLHLHDFLGAWRLSREIDDRLSGRPGRFEGTATLTPGGEGLRYREEGLLQVGEGPAMAATRDYLWLPSPEGIEMRFADGRPFHHFCPEGRAPGTDHPCGRDLYRVLYDFTAWPAWEAEWTVAGPAKDYRMRSSYRR
ncbi:DUF6314 family protein [Rubellimicrobium roseum]|uniref:DUF6314 domain-containing protein n=1 Tax=Rubellimicrobium roseum TaxID=687525 RepID=A0A5C4NFL1_9RHOB|nr:DUF6314 family protein [Rubellimicrobium roseum]TNC73433.1 hypothetical protein FHG71_06215 [Rubellimicrobium roseum]